MHEIRLKRLRKELNLSKDELIELFESHDLEMSIAHLNIYEEHGIGKEVNWAFWENVAEVFDVDVAYLLNLRLARKEQELINENEFLRDENQRLNNDLNNTITELEAFIYGRKDKKTVN